MFTKEKPAHLAGDTLMTSDGGQGTIARGIQRCQHILKLDKSRNSQSRSLAGSMVAATASTAKPFFLYERISGPQGAHLGKVSTISGTIIGAPCARHRLTKERGNEMRNDFVIWQGSSNGTRGDATIHETGEHHHPVRLPPISCRRHMAKQSLSLMQSSNSLRS